VGNNSGSYHNLKSSASNKIYMIVVKQRAITQPIKGSYGTYNIMVQWVARLTRSVEVVGSSPIKCLRSFLEQETLPLLLII